MSDILSIFSICLVLFFTSLAVSQKTGKEIELYYEGVKEDFISDFKFALLNEKIDLNLKSIVNEKGISFDLIPSTADPRLGYLKISILVNPNFEIRVEQFNSLDKFDSKVIEEAEKEIKKYIVKRIEPFTLKKKLFFDDELNPIIESLLKREIKKEKGLLSLFLNKVFLDGNYKKVKSYLENQLIYRFDLKGLGGDLPGFKLTREFILNLKEGKSGVEVITPPYDPYSKNEILVSKFFEEISKSKKVSFSKGTAIHEHFGVILPGEYSSSAIIKGENLFTGKMEYFVFDNNYLQKIMKGVVLFLDEMLKMDKNFISRHQKLVNDYFENPTKENIRYKYAKPFSDEELFSFQKYALRIIKETEKPEEKINQRIINSLLNVKFLDSKISKKRSLNFLSLVRQGTVEIRLYDTTRKAIKDISKLNKDLTRKIPISLNSHRWDSVRRDLENKICKRRLKEKDQR